MKRILVSACLLGTPCRYDGKEKLCPAVMALSKNADLIPVCPEVLGGLPTPRLPAERVGDRVLCANGMDVTENYLAGAEVALTIAKENKVHAVLLKSKSPSCGFGVIHNGRFDGGFANGNGVTAALLSGAGFPVFTEDSLDELLRFIEK